MFCPFFVLRFLLSNKSQPLTGTLLPPSLSSIAKTTTVRLCNTPVGVSRLWGNFVPLECQICCFRLPAEKAEVSTDFHNLTRKQACFPKRDCYKQIRQLHQRSYICIARSRMWQAFPSLLLQLRPPVPLTWAGVPVSAALWFERIKLFVWLFWFWVFVSSQAKNNYFLSRSDSLSTPRQLNQYKRWAVKRSAREMTSSNLF